MEGKSNTFFHQGSETVYLLLTQLLEVEKLRLYLRAGVKEVFCRHEVLILQEYNISSGIWSCTHSNLIN